MLFRSGGQLTAGGQLAAHIPLPGFPPREGVDDSGVLPDPMDASDSTSLVRSGGGAIVEVPLERYELSGWEQMSFACSTFQPAVEYSVPLMLASPLGISGMSGSSSLGGGQPMIAMNAPVILNQALTVHGEVSIHQGLPKG